MREVGEYKREATEIIISLVVLIIKTEIIAKFYIRFDILKVKRK